MIDKIFEIFFETLCYLVNADDFHYFLVCADFILTVLIVAAMGIFNKKIGRKRAVDFALLATYSFVAFVSSAFLRWWFGLIVAALCFFWIRSLEKLIWKGEIEEKKIEGEVKDLLLSPKGIILNMALSFAVAQYVIFIVTFQ